MAGELIARLRAENASLISDLKQGVSHLKISFNEEKRKVLSDLKIHNNQQSNRQHARNRLDFRPTTVVRSDTGNLPKPDVETRLPTNGKGAVTSTPVAPKVLLEVDGNLRHKAAKTARTPKSAQQKRRPKSILVTPDTRKTPKSQKQKVYFPSDCIDTKMYTKDYSTVTDKSFLGYDWIAGVLDNESENTSLSENFFNEIKEFRRVNKDECMSNIAVTSASSSEKGQTPTRKLPDFPPKRQDLGNSGGDFCSGSTYTVDGRLMPVPIHGPYSQCPACQTKPEPESEYSESYIRVSVPRSSLKSPYRIKPHRRKSFDPSDSVALSEHCLAGWQCARPAFAPGPDALDLKSSIKYAENLPVTDIQSLKSSYQRTTEELLNSTVKMRYGLQLLEGRNSKHANTTAYPAF